MLQNKFNYLDQVKKIEYYKHLIVDDYLKKGKVIDKVALQAKLDQIDTKLAVFSQKTIKNGDMLDLDTYNKQKNGIYRDLCFLYEILYELAEDRLSTLEHKIDCEINALTELAKKYQNRTKLETLGIYGNSIYYKTNDFNQEYENGTVRINLGPVTVPSGSYVACICNCDEINSSDITFEFDGKYSVSDYLHSHKYLKILGNYKLNTTNIRTEESRKALFKLSETDINGNSIFNVFAGRDMLQIYHSNTGTTEYVPKSVDISFVAEDECEISFYVYGASFINLDIVGDYNYKSFNCNSINSPAYRHKILINAKKGFKLDFVTDGKVFADKAATIISDGNVYSSKSYDNIYEYMLEEIIFGGDIFFDNVTVIAKNATTTFYDINYIAIKQCKSSELENGEGW